MTACRYCDAWFASEDECGWHEARCSLNPNASDDDVTTGTDWQE